MPKKYLALILLTLLTFLQSVPAQAYYWGFPYWGGYNWAPNYGYASSWLWPLQSLAYPGYYGRYYRYPYNYGYNYSYLPLYLGGSLLSSAVAYGTIAQLQRSQAMDQQRAYDTAMLQQGQARMQTYSSAPYVVDQNAHANWNRQPIYTSPQPVAYQPPPEITPVQYPPPVVLPPAQLPVPPLPPTQRAYSLPPVAPAFQRPVNTPIALLPAINGAPLLAQANAPLAAGFVDLVNSKYDGNLSVAMHNREAQSLAQSLGLVSTNSSTVPRLDHSKNRLIRGILKDSTLEPPDKVRAIAAVIRH